jgi:hypothetical protein
MAANNAFLPTSTFNATINFAVEMTAGGADPKAQFNTSVGTVSLQQCLMIPTIRHVLIM